MRKICSDNRDHLSDRLGDDLAECFAEGLNINRRRLKALYKRESGFVLAYVRRA
jgi:hypothetical protein